jgi:iron-sulfur cluster repair protein YtfE (RIC family)
MALRHHHFPAPRPDMRLRDEHAELDRRFDDLHARAASGEWSLVDEVWDDFARDLEAHLAFEEHDVFPLVAAQMPDGAALVDRLRGHHVAIRRHLAELGVSIQLHAVSADTLASFVAAVREHARLEGERVYPWLEGRGHVAPLTN